MLVYITRMIPAQAGNFRYEFNSIEGSKMLALILPRKDASRKLRQLLRSKAVDTGYRIESDENNVYVPVHRVPEDFTGATCEMEFGGRESEKSPYSRVLDLLRQNNVNISGVPSRWTRYGSSIVIKYNGEDYGEIGAAFSRVLHVDSVYVQSGGITGTKRVPSVRLIHGPGGDITHVENGIRYRFDPARVMFSPGNVSIRTSMRDIDMKNRIVFDMFAGIGYFSLPIAKYGKPDRVYACDINPVSVEYLRRNVILNKLEDYFTVWNDDSRNIKLEEKADLVIMGNFESPDFIESAVSNLNIPGEIIIHYLCPTHRLDDPEEDIFTRIRDTGLLPELKERVIVKSYSPHNWHVASSIIVSSTNEQL